MERGEIERRQKDRRQGDRRAKLDFICDLCGTPLIYFIPNKLDDKEYMWCDSCQQRYVVLRFPELRPQLARVNNV